MAQRIHPVVTPEQGSRGNNHDAPVLAESDRPGRDDVFVRQRRNLGKRDVSGVELHQRLFGGKMSKNFSQDIVRFFQNLSGVVDQ